MNLQLLNLQDLLRLRLYNTTAREALILLETGDSAVRDAVSNAETEGNQALLASLEELISFYALCEIAALAGVISNRLPTQFRRRSLNIIRNPHVKRYSEYVGNSILLNLFRLRLEGHNHLRELDSAAGIQLFAGFLDLVREESQNRASGLSWLGLFRSSATDPQSREFATVADFGEAREFATLNSSEQNRIEEKLLTFRSFLMFCQELERFLAQASDYPLLQSSLWHYHLFGADDRKVRVFWSYASRSFSKWSEQSDVELSKGLGSLLKLVDDQNHAGPIMKAYDALVQSAPRNKLRGLERLEGAGLVELARVPPALRGRVAQVLGQLSTPRNNVETRSLVNALIAIQELMEHSEYSDLLSKMGDFWNDWLLESPIGHDTERPVTEWVSRLVPKSKSE